MYSTNLYWSVKKFVSRYKIQWHIQHGWIEASQTALTRSAKYGALKYGSIEECIKNPVVIMWSRRVDHVIQLATVET